MNATEILALPEMQSLWQRVQEQSADAAALRRDWKKTAGEVCRKLARRGKPWTAARVYDGMLQMLDGKTQRQLQAALAAQ